MINILKYNEFINENETYSYGCVMAFYDNSEWTDITGEIEQEDLLNGLESIESEPHVTLLYGLHNDIDHDAVINYMRTRPNPRVVITEIDLFENDKFDVVKFKVENPIFNKINSFLKDNFEYTNNFPIYDAHMTIAYVKKGKGKKYTKTLDKPIYLTSGYYVYSKSTGEKEIITI